MNTFLFGFIAGVFGMTIMHLICMYFQNKYYEVKIDDYSAVCINHKFAYLMSEERYLKLTNHLRKG